MSKMTEQKEAEFQTILQQLTAITKRYDNKEIKHYEFAGQMDNTFDKYGWKKQDFYAELNARLNIQTNETRQKKNSDKPPKKSKKAKAKPAVV